MINDNLRPDVFFDPNTKYTKNNKPRVIVGLSGGVDSAVSAKLLVDSGQCEVIGVFLKNWNEKDAQCPASTDAIDARMVAEKLKIPFYTFDYSQQYRAQVFEYFLSENRAGRTPNPDILCNKYIKFGVFLEQAKQLGATFIATGHYAKKKFNDETEQYELLIPEDKNKDQTYFMHAINQDQLAKSIFPLADITKPEVRKLAKKWEFNNANKKDSTGICFVGERNYSKFLQEYLKKKPGKIVTYEGRIVGEHIGLSFYTLGQRRELGIGGISGEPEGSWFVIKKKFDTNELIISQDEKLLLSDTIKVQNCSWISGRIPAKNFTCDAKVRYRQESRKCKVQQISEDEVVVQFEIPQRAITPGQSVVFYDEDVCLGGGEIS